LGVVVRIIQVMVSVPDANPAVKRFISNGTYLLVAEGNQLYFVQPSKCDPDNNPSPVLKKPVYHPDIFQVAADQVLALVKTWLTA
jgi:hypothetical protein